MSKDTPVPAASDLEQRLREAAKRKMTPAERREQRISFVYGQIMDCAPHITREQVAAIVDEAAIPDHRR